VDSERIMPVSWEICRTWKILLTSKGTGGSAALYFPPLALLMVRPNVHSAPKPLETRSLSTLGDETDDRILCQYSAPRSYFVIYSIRVCPPRWRVTNIYLDKATSWSIPVHISNGFRGRPIHYSNGWRIKMQNMHMHVLHKCSTAAVELTR